MHYYISGSDHTHNQKQEHERQSQQGKDKTV